MNYDLVRSSRKTISIEITAEGKLIVRAPLRYSLQNIHRFIDLKQAWISRILEQQSRRICLCIPAHIEEGTPIPLFGNWYAVRWGPQKNPVIDEFLSLPNKWQDSDVQKKVIAWAKKSALDYLTARTKEISSFYGIEFRSITITHAKKRLGSCNRKKEIRYSWRIMMLPTPLSDYIIMHELAHIKIHSHRKAFWKILKEWIPDLPLRKKELNQYLIT